MSPFENLASATSIERVREIIQLASVEVRGAGSNSITLLFSGNIGDMPTGMMAEAIGEGSANIITINKTEAFELLNSDEFKGAMRRLYGTDQTRINQALYGVSDPVTGQRLEKGLWDIASENLAKNASGGNVSS